MSRFVVTGGAGFVGSHLCDALIRRGDSVVCIDNLSTGARQNIAHLLSDPLFSFIEQDICSAWTSIEGVDAVLHLASPASPPEYLRMPLQTLEVGSTGTRNALALAQASGARFVLASTSEVYGDPAVHPQPEQYWGNVNPVGPRSVYDEAKRFAEALSAAHARTLGTNVGIVRIFNTYGPRLRPSDGRVVSNFIAQALRDEPLTVYGDGQQTRSFCYVEDLVRGLLQMTDCHELGPVNLGNPVECTVLDLAELIIDLTQSGSSITFAPLPIDDPVRRKPDISRAAAVLGWKPETDLRAGLERTIDWQRAKLALRGSATR